MHWQVGWCIGEINAANADFHETIGDDVVNFFVRYERDGDVSSHVLDLEDYEVNGPEDSWVLLNADTAATDDDDDDDDNDNDSDDDMGGVGGGGVDDAGGGSKGSDGSDGSRGGVGDGDDDSSSSGDGGGEQARATP